MNRLVSFGGPRLRRRLLTGPACASLFLLATPAEAATRYGDNTMLPPAVRQPGHSSVVGSVVSGTGNAALHMLVGLAIVCALIFALYKILRRSATKNDRTVRDDGWMQVVSSTPLAPSRSLHLVRVGDEAVLLASSEQSVTTIKVYSPEDVRSLGLDLSQTKSRGPGRANGNPPFATALVESLKRMTAR